VFHYSACIHGSSHSEKGLAVTEYFVCLCVCVCVNTDRTTVELGFYQEGGADDSHDTTTL